MSNFPVAFVDGFAVRVMTPEQIKERARLNETNTASAIRRRVVVASNGAADLAQKAMNR